jgi:hypothetical protein
LDLLCGANLRFRTYVAVSSALFDAEEVMPHRRRVQKGSFGGHFDELVKHFPAEDRKRYESAEPKARPRELQDRIDLHARLFDWAWKVDDRR